MFAKDELVTAEGVAEAECAAAAVQYRSSVNRPLYRYTCLHCLFRGENIADLELAERTARSHADRCRHRVRLSFDVLDVEVTTYSGEEPRG